MSAELDAEGRLRCCPESSATSVELKADSGCALRRWRLQAEVAMRARGKPGMTDAQVADFVDRYMPAYRAYLKALYAEGPTTSRPGRLLEIHINESRTPVSGKAS